MSALSGFGFKSDSSSSRVPASLLGIYVVKRGNVLLTLLKNFLWFRASRQLPIFGVGTGSQSVISAALGGFVDRKSSRAVEGP